MRCAAGHERPCSGWHLDLVGADLDPQATVEHIPGFIIAVMDVPWRDQPRWSGGAAGVTPFGEDKSARLRP